MAEEYGFQAVAMTRSFDEKGDIHGEVVNDLPQSNTSVDWKYCRSSLLHVLFLIHALTTGVDVPLR